EDAEALEDAREWLALPKRLAGMVLAADLLDGHRQHALLDFAGNHHHAVGVAHDDILRAHQDARTHHRHLDLHHPPAPFGIEGADAAMEDREAHLYDLTDVAHQPVGDAAGRLAREARGC